MHLAALIVRGNRVRQDCYCNGQPFTPQCHQSHITHRISSIPSTTYASTRAPTSDRWSGFRAVNIIWIMDNGMGQVASLEERKRLTPASAPRSFYSASGSGKSFPFRPPGTPVYIRKYRPPSLAVARAQCGAKLTLISITIIQALGRTHLTHCTLTKREPIQDFKHFSTRTW